jgi:predicted DNA-binding antitoxin AbrB/MazE fold protein
MSETIEAIYENGLFKPVGPVALPEGTRVHIKVEASAAEVEERIQQQASARGADEIEVSAAEVEEQIRQQALAAGHDPAETERILANFRLLWRSYDTLTDEQKAAYEATLRRGHCCDHGE